MRGILAFLLCTLLGWSAAASAKQSVEIGYMPIIPVSQAFVVLENGALAKAGIDDPKLVKFQNGPAIVQALLAGQLDVAYLGIGPAMVARAKGADIKVVASDIVEQISMLALGDLAPYFANGDAATAFERFRQDKGHKPVITTFPKGSVPETVFQYWLRERLGLSEKQITDNIDIIYQGAAQVQQSLMTGAVDGAAILEPIVSSVVDRKKDARIVASGSQLFPHQPGAVLVVRQKLIDNHPDLVQALVKAHIDATDALRNDPAKVVNDVAKYVGGGRLPKALVLKALQRSAEHFEADPNAIIDGTRQMRDFQSKLGSLKVKVDLSTLFDTRFYDQAAQAK